jgi:hypothetical protein
LEGLVKNLICHVEIPADDIPGLTDFYKGLFQWEFSNEGQKTEYLVSEPEKDKPTIGLIKRQTPDHRPVHYVRVDSVLETIQRANELGGAAVFPRTSVEGMGWFAVIMDPQNNAIGLWEDDDKAP